MFFERQKLGATQLRWLYLAVTVVSSIVMLMTTSHEGNRITMIWMMAIFLLFMGGTYFLVFELPALTRITQRGVEMKYRPWIWNWKVLAWHDIKNIAEINVDPLGDFGGWGYRFTFKGKRGIIMGNGHAVKIELKSGKEFVLTTNRKAELLRNASQFLNEDGLNG